MSDASPAALQQDIARLAEKGYHERASAEDVAKPVEIGECFVFGAFYSTIFPAVVVNKSGKVHSVFIIIDTDSPVTCLSENVSNPTSRKGIRRLTTIDEQPDGLERSQ